MKRERSGTGEENTERGKEREKRGQKGKRYLD